MPLSHHNQTIYQSILPLLTCYPLNQTINQQIPSLKLAYSSSYQPTNPNVKSIIAVHANSPIHQQNRDNITSSESSQVSQNQEMEILLGREIGQVTLVSPNSSIRADYIKHNLCSCKQSALLFMQISKQSTEDLFSSESLTLYRYFSIIIIFKQQSYR